MSADKTPWSQLVVGERVRGRGGVVWTIGGKSGDADGYDVTLHRLVDGQVVEKRHISVKATDRVEVVPLTDDLETANNILAVHTSADDEWTTFPGAHAYSAATMLAHLKIVHGIDVADVTSPFTRHITAHGAGEAAKPHEHGQAKSA